MVDKLSGFIRKKKVSGLYKQWVVNDGLSPEDVPNEDVRRDGEAVSSNSAYPEEREETDTFSARYYAGGRTIVVPVRYIWITAGVVAILLVALSVVITILVTK